MIRRVLTATGWAAIYLATLALLASVLWMMHAAGGAYGGTP